MLHTKKLIICGLCLILSFSLVRVPAYAVTGEEPSAPASSEQVVNQQEDISAIASDQDGSAVADDGHDDASSEDPAVEQHSQTEDEIVGEADRIDAADAIEFVYLENRAIALGKEQHIAIGLVDEDAVITSAQLLLECSSDESVQVEDASTVSGNAALFMKKYEDESDTAAYRLLGVLYTTQSSDKVRYAEFESGEETGEVYQFDVVTQSVADALNDSDGVSEDDDVSAFAVKDDGSLVATDSVGAAIQAADEQGVRDTDAGDSIVDQEMLNKGITGEEDAEGANGSSTKQDGIGSLFASVFGAQDAWAAETAGRENYLIVALDPGHGGSDSGATGYGLTEKATNLSIAQHCFDELNTYSGVTPYLTRTNDEYVGLQERVDRAVAYGADVFISIHCNSSGDGSACGSEVWVPNDSSYNHDTHIDGTELGAKILAKLTSLGLNNRGVKTRDSENVDGEGPFYYPDGSIQDYYTVIEASRNEGIPGIIVEHAFIDNASDASKLADDSFRQQLGRADASGIADKYRLVKDTEARSRATIAVTAHVSDLGWESTVYDKKVAGTTGKSKGLEAFRANIQNLPGVGISYRSYVGDDWQSWVSDGTTSGTTGQSTPLQAVQMRLTGANSSNYDIYYRVHVSNVGWLGWAKNGASAGSMGYDYGAEAVETAIVAKGAPAPGDTTTPYKIKTETVSYQAHVSDVGWQSSVGAGATAGTTGQSRAIEALKIGIANRETNGSVQYNVHCANLGWQGWRSDGAMGGTTGESRQTEAIQIRLTGDLAEKYDIYYRVHSAEYGWLDWAKNGEKAGTQGYGYSMQAIQIELVKKGGEAPGPTTSPSHEALVSYDAHVSNVGWQDEAFDGATAGTTGQSLPMEALQVTLRNQAYSGGVQVSAHVSNVGWQDYTTGVAGTTGQSLAMEAVQIQLTGEMSNQYDIYYRVHSAEYGWLDWAKNGEKAGTQGYGYSMQAIQIELVKKGGEAPGSTDRPFKEHRTTVDAQAHVADIGWQSPVAESQTAGTIGQNLAMQALKLTLQDAQETGSIEYAAHVADIGWQNWVGSGATAGTTGRNLQMEAVQIRLTGDLAEKYDIYYRVHSAEYGWLDWAKNGEKAGTQGYGYSMQAIQIELVKKGGEAPGSTDEPFMYNEPSNFQGTSIMGASTVSVSQMVDTFNSKDSAYPSLVYTKYGAPTIEQFCTILREEAETEGVRAEVVFAQAMLETGWLQFGGDVSAEQCNFAGLGATGGVPGNSFNDWGNNSVRKGLRAQVQHLKCYACENSLANDCVDLRWSDHLRGMAPYVEWLSIPNNPYGSGWATDPKDDYADNIKGIIAECSQK